MKLFYNIILGVTLLGGVNIYAGNANLIKNGNFANLSPANLPLDWQLRVKSNDIIEIKDNALLLQNRKESDSLFLIQSDIPLKNGQSYLVKYDVAAPLNAQYRIYIEAMKTQDGKRSSTSFLSAWKKGDSDNYQSIQEIFTFPADWEKPYIVIQIKGNIPVKLRNLELKDVSQFSMFNSDFSIISNGRPLNWDLRGNQAQFKFSPNLATLKVEPGKPLWMIYSFQAHQGGATYIIRGEVRGSGNTKYRAYYEWMQKDNNNKIIKSASSGASLVVTPESWTAFEKKITLPEKISSAIMAINAEGDGTVEFRNISVEPENKVDPALLEAGGKWQLGKGSKIVNIDNFQSIEILPDAPSVLTQIPIVPSQRYKLSYQALGIGDSSHATGFHYFKLALRFNNGEKIEIPEDDVWKTSVQKKNFSFRAPQNADKLDIICTVTNGNKICFGNFAMEAQKATDEDLLNISLTVPAYRDTIYSDSNLRFVSGIAEAPGIASLSIKLMTGKCEIPAEIKKIQGDRYSFSIPCEKLPDGDYKIIMSCKMPDGKTAQITKNLKKVSDAKNKITGDGKGNFSINSQPFFPIILMAPDAPYSDSAFYKLGRSGFNVIRVMGTPEKLKKQLDLAEKYGLKLIVSFGHIGTTQNDYKLWSHQAYSFFNSQLQKHPALFGYFLVDEPSWVGIPASSVLSGYELLKKLDPYHPVWINAAPRGDLAEHQLYSSGSDIYGLDIYPVPYPNSHSSLEDKGLTCVGKYTDFMRKSSGKSKSVWMMLQGFAWETFKANQDPAKIVYPTMTETRFMVFDALTSGANAVGYWGNQYIDKPEFYQELFDMAMELQQLSGVFYDTGAVKVEQQNSVSIYTYPTKAGNVYLLLNRSDKSADIVFNGKAQTLKPFDALIQAAKLPPPVNKITPFNAELEKINPFETVSLQRNHNYSEPFGGKADWIWSSTHAKVAGSKCAAAIIIDLDKLPEQAEIQAAADDSCQVFVNGKEIGQSKLWTFMVRSSIKKYLKTGKNLIVISGKDGGALPCGIIGKVIIGNQTFPTGKTWYASSDFSSDDFTKIEKITTWPEAEILTAYGSGAWGSSVKMPKIKLQP